MLDNRARDFITDKEQITSDEELFDTAKVNYKTLDKMTLKDIQQGILSFGESLADLRLYPYEIEFAERIIWSLITGDGETITGEFARQGGKSTTVSVVANSCSIMLPLFAEYITNPLSKFNPSSKYYKTMSKFRRGFWCGVYGPDYERASIVGSKINEQLNSKRGREILSSKSIGMKFPDRLQNFIGNLPRSSKIKVKSANKRVSIEGDTHHLVITDETQEISDYVLKKSISPMLAATLGTTVHIGSAYPERVYFYDILQMNKREDLNPDRKIRNNFSVDYRTVQKYNPHYAEYIKKEKKKLGENSDEFRMSYELYWPIESGMFITEDLLLGRLGQSYFVSNYDVKNDHVIGIDLAKVKDSTVVTVAEVDWNSPIVIDEESRTTRYRKKIKNWLELSGDDYDTQFYMICNFIDHYKWNKLVVDATGVGAPMFDRLYNKYVGKGKLVVPFVYSLQSKSEGYELLYRELLAERWIVPNNEKVGRLKKHKKFVEQMTNLAKEIKGGYLTVSHTSENGHDDYPDSMMLLNWGIESELGKEEAEQFEENIFKNSQVGFRRTADFRQAGNFWGN